MSVIEDTTELIYPDGDDQLAAVFPHDRYLFSVTSAVAIRKLTPTEKKKARDTIADFFHLSEQNRSQIDYTQARPFDPSVDPRDGFRGDCSSYGTQSFYWTRDQLDGPPLHDPNGVIEMDGYGFTGTLLATNHAHPVPRDGSRKFLVGDLALFGSSFWGTRHVVFCSQPGYVKDAVWSSHGSSAGPVPVRLTYRRDLLGVYRPVSLL